jgi:hypothetical protein
MSGDVELLQMSQHARPQRSGQRNLPQPVLFDEARVLLKEFVMQSAVPFTVTMLAARRVLRLLKKMTRMAPNVRAMREDSGFA